MRILLVSVFLASLGLAGGCNGTSKLGEVGDLEFWSVRSWSPDGGNLAMIVTKDKKTGKVDMGEASASQSFFQQGGTAMISGGASAGGMALLRPPRSNTSNNTNVQSSNENSNSASANQSQGQFQGQIQGQAQTQTQEQKGGGHHNHGHHGRGPP